MFPTGINSIDTTDVVSTDAIIVTPEPAPKAAHLTWGFPGAAPEGASHIWGARAIYKLIDHDTVYARTGRGMPRKVLHRACTEASIDIPFDRHEMISPALAVEGTIAAAVTNHAHEKERKAFAKWIQNKGIPALRKWCIKEYITGDCDAKFELTEGGYSLVAGPRASYGYLYITAWAVAS